MAWFLGASVSLRVKWATTALWAVKDRGDSEGSAFISGSGELHALLLLASPPAFLPVLALLSRVATNSGAGGRLPSAPSPPPLSAGLWGRGPRRQVGSVLPARLDPQSTRGGLGCDGFLDCSRWEITLSYQGHFDQIFILVPRSLDSLLLPEFPMWLQQGQKLVRKSQPFIACVSEVEPGLGCSEEQQPLFGPLPTPLPKALTSGYFSNAKSVTRSLRALGSRKSVLTGCLFPLDLWNQGGSPGPGQRQVPPPLRYTAQATSS